MGNCTSCCYIEPQIATIIDVGGNFRQVKLPITAADLMLDEPGHLISPTENLRRTHRYEAMPADQPLSPGKLYMFVPAVKLHCKLSQSDMAKLDSVYKRRPAKRRSSKVQPSATEETGERGERPLANLGENVTGLPGYRLGNHTQWRPVLEPIYEGI